MTHPTSTEIYFNLNNGTRIPAIGLGTASPKDRYPETKEAVKAAIRAGYRHIDTAYFYKTEPYIGQALKELFESAEIKREELFITTKVWPTFWNNPSDSIDQSLKDLGIDYVDLVLQHWPVCFQKVENSQGNIIGLPRDKDGNALFEKDADWLFTYKALEKIYLDPKDNRVRAIGVSNYPIEYLERLFKECKVTPAINQVEVHPHLPQLELNKFCHDHAILLTAYSPLGSDGAPNLKIKSVQDLAKKYKVEPADILTSYHISKGNVVLPRSLNPKRIAANVSFAKLTDDDLSKLDQVGIDEPNRFIDEFFTSEIPGFTGTK
ncbi:D-arabinose 1-dehydrogenase (NAD(P)(+)) ARA1 NDAI_0A07000 [Naumovozyma dairenensis CBS 421]|uniref:NADP-dependent oxidoreductase domain-containing protein n=1 Tax=Naumovozyma dairenensis (strain ATCC 10597 / BCRC 20456 / CBS 421 / NBRC 0211 / NRRL Y-12639) TaxID=1071378 RepID=G0W4W6_NAUDC|nr:hypothetical protein NDAI_0A07000 [Naumovozyma dairenensis CBS 421]CCD22854.1 hypothetical protein NDAI_0A07000 [Naumovozyma dairenensis CBS 421]